MYGTNSLLSQVKEQASWRYRYKQLIDAQRLVLEVAQLLRLSHAHYVRTKHACMYVVYTWRWRWSHGDGDGDGDFIQYTYACI